MTGNAARIRCIVDGFVQGVGFRMYTQRVAAELGAVGYVRNLYDGSVEVVAEGEREVLRRLLDRVERGPIGARVTDVSLEWDTPTGQFSRFEIRR